MLVEMYKTNKHFQLNKKLQILAPPVLCKKFKSSRPADQICAWMCVRVCMCAYASVDMCVCARVALLNSKYVIHRFLYKRYYNIRFTPKSDFLYLSTSTLFFFFIPFSFFTLYSYYIILLYRFSWCTIYKYLCPEETEYIASIVDAWLACLFDFQFK